MSRGCCCEVEGEDCIVCSGAPGGDEFGVDAWTLDLGLGGWSNNHPDGSQCGIVAGEFSLTGPGTPSASSPYCRWQRLENEWDKPLCTVASPVEDKWFRLQLLLTIIDNPSGPGWLYRCTVLEIMVSSLGSEVCSGGLPASQAVYTSASTTSTNCLSLLNGSGDLQLDKLSDAHADGGFDSCCVDAPCSGTLPDTIFARPNII